MAGTTIGASMLALPLVAAQVGLSWAFILMVVSWFFMLTNAYIIVRMMAPYPKSSTFRSIAQDVLGPWGKYAITAAMMFLFYSLLAAYGAGAANLLNAYVPIGHSLMITLIFCGLGGDSLERCINGLSQSIVVFLLLLFVFVAMIPLWDMMIATPLVFNLEVPSMKGLLAALLIYITSFGFHGSIASLVKYNDKNMACVKQSFFLGTLLACFYTCYGP